jgi:hypothetical protein
MYSEAGDLQLNRLAWGRLVVPEHIEELHLKAGWVLLLIAVLVENDENASSEVLAVEVLLESEWDDSDIVDDDISFHSGCMSSRMAWEVAREKKYGAASRCVCSFAADSKEQNNGIASV